MLNNNKVNKVMENGYAEKMYKLLENANGNLIGKEWINLIADLHYNTDDDIQVMNVYEVTCNIDKRNAGIIEFKENGKMYVHLLLCNVKTQMVAAYEICNDNVIHRYNVNLLQDRINGLINKIVAPLDEKIVRAIYKRKAENCLMYKFVEKKEVREKKEVKNNKNVKANVNNVVVDNKKYNRYEGVDYMKNLVNNNVMERIAENKLNDMMNNEKIAKLAKFDEMDIDNMKVKELFELFEGVPELYNEICNNPIIKLAIDEKELKEFEKAMTGLKDIEDVKKAVVNNKEVKADNKPNVNNVLNVKPEMKFNKRVDNYRNDLYVPRAKNEIERKEEVYVPENFLAKAEENLAHIFGNHMCKYF